MIHRKKQEWSPQLPNQIIATYSTLGMPCRAVPPELHVCTCMLCPQNHAWPVQYGADLCRTTQTPGTAPSYFHPRTIPPSHFRLVLALHVYKYGVKSRCKPANSTRCTIGKAAHENLRMPTCRRKGNKVKSPVAGHAQWRVSPAAQRAEGWMICLRADAQGP